MTAALHWASGGPPPAPNKTRRDTDIRKAPWGTGCAAHQTGHGAGKPASRHRIAHDDPTVGTDALGPLLAVELVRRCGSAR